jgi:DNA-binding transcriptional regulator YiaG
MKPAPRIKETVISDARKFKMMMAEAGISQARLAELIDVHPNTVSTWATGAVQTPGPVAAYLRLVGRVRDLLHDLDA